jgi:hypothetical protein
MSREFTSPPVPLSASREGEPVDNQTPLSTLWRGVGGEVKRFLKDR